MNEDTSHLYTVWNYDEATAFADRFAEFRIIQVGEHLNDSTDSNSGDGSTVTFMATYSLPTAKQMNFTGINAGGWKGSAMYTDVFGSGGNTEGYVATGLSGLKDAVTKVTKKSTVGSCDSGWTDAISTDAFWLISYSELIGENKEYVLAGYFRNEGSQYTWCSTDNLRGIDKTRSGASPAGAINTCWWQRSPFVINRYIFSLVDTEGRPYNSIAYADRVYSVVPCFCF